MNEPKGRYLPLSAPRRFILDLVHYAKQIPTIPVARVIDIKPLIAARDAHPARPSWAILFMRAYARVCAEHPPLRRALVTFPWTRVYEHPQSVCSLAMERDYEGEPAIFVGLFRSPETQELDELLASLKWYRTSGATEIGFYRQMIRISGYPWFIRRFLWWTTLNISGFKRAKRLGTFGLSSYGSLGAEQIHPISPLTTTLTYGPIDVETGRVTVKVIYDHRVLDGAWIARRLEDLETTLNGPIREELLGEGRK